MSGKRVIVVGTTSDYIDIIDGRFPGRALFITAPGERAAAKEPPPDDKSEFLCDLADYEQAASALVDHLKRHEIEPSGIACFDCESLELASHFAAKFSLPFCSRQAITNSRNKFLSKRLWAKAGLSCPKTELVTDAPTALDFLKKVGGPIVLKPQTGSGSELVFLCKNESDCRTAVKTMRDSLAVHPNGRMYSSTENAESAADVRHLFAAEEFISGTEYSCDFIIDNGRVELIRIARKIPADGHPLGTIRAYELPAKMPEDFDSAAFSQQLFGAATALGIDRSIVMLDFFVRGDRAVMIEMTPRPGGDCLPPLIRHSSGLDMLEMALDFAEGKDIHIPRPDKWKPLVGLRMFANRAGVIARIDPAYIDNDRRVLECYLKRQAGHRVVMPPQDYDSRYLGYIIIDPAAKGENADDCLALGSRLALEMETETWVKSTIS